MATKTSYQINYQVTEADSPKPIKGSVCYSTKDISEAIDAARINLGAEVESGDILSYVITDAKEVSP